jgi:hypothetical protein
LIAFIRYQKKEFLSIGPGQLKNTRVRAFGRPSVAARGSPWARQESEGPKGAARTARGGTPGESGFLPRGVKKAPIKKPPK